MELHNIIYALGIRGVGKYTSKILAKFIEEKCFGDLELFSFLIKSNKDLIPVTHIRESKNE